MKPRELRDWYIILHISLFGIGVLTYAFVHPSIAAFATACGALTSVVGMYHWFIVRANKAEAVKNGILP